MYDLILHYFLKRNNITFEVNNIEKRNIKYVRLVNITAFLVYSKCFRAIAM